MSAKIENENGIISISNEVIANIAGDAATSCYGVVGMAVRSKVDGIASLLKRDVMSKGIKVTVENNELIIDVHIIVGYGINIKSTSESIFESVKYNVEKVTGFSVKEVNIHVESVKADD
ncbi:MAG: Asp23/Gls24 family envelope stress response protein [Clostridia bacterium]|nr:Asp23/Gls24 family envelope stress response protein [Clostridia bacterium]